MDQSKKTMRHFYCRDVLWETFEQMANDFDCSIDYLVNEAMRFYARSKNYQAPAGNTSLSGIAPLGNTPPPSSATAPGSSPSRPPPPPAAATRPPSPVSTAPVPKLTPVTQSPGPVLFLMYNEQRMAIEKDQFIIGR